MKGKAMQKSIRQYLYALTGSDYNLLFDLLSYRYKKFIEVYWLLKRYSENIIDIYYDNNEEKNTLLISASFSDIPASEVATYIKKNAVNKKEIKIKSDKEELLIKIKKEEEV